MSKEQTPITAEEYPRLYGWELKNENGIEMAILPAEKIRKLVEWCEKEDERTQAKVLEALEVVKTLTDNNVSVKSEYIDNLIRSKTKL